ncbi:MAG: hypothetical protein ABI598_00680 [Chloroflexota bacterium]
MLEQPSDFKALLTVRDGQLAVVTCGACGCRLQSTSASPNEWKHFGQLAGRDAMGHRPACVELAHDGSGRAAVTA